MFAKLLKYEWKSTAKLFSILSVAAILLGVIGTAVSGIAFSLIHDSFTSYSDDVGILVGMAMLSVLFFVIISIVAYSVAIQFILAYRFYKNKYTDEGYLTFTLPVTPKDIFLSSATNMTIWTFISAVISLASMIAILVAMMSSMGYFNSVDLEYIKQDFEYMHQSLTVLEGALSIVQIGLTFISYVVSLLVSVVSIITSITIGSVIVKKYKILASVGIYYAINFGMSLVSTLVTSVPEIIGALLTDSVAMMICQIIAILLQIILYCVLCVVGYKVSTNLMEKKLNLP